MSTQFAKIKAIFRDRNTSFYRIVDGHTLKIQNGNSILRPTCAGKSTTLEVNGLFDSSQLVAYTEFNLRNYMVDSSLF